MLCGIAVETPKKATMICASGKFPGGLPQDEPVAAQG